jgi:hypothetical protein
MPEEYVELYLHSPNTPVWRGAQLKYGDNFTFNIMLVTGMRRMNNFCRILTMVC